MLFRSRVSKIIGWGAVVRADFAANLAIILGSYGRELLPYIGITHMGEYSKESCLFHAWLCRFSQAICRLLPMFNGDFLPYVNNPNTIYTTDISSIRGLDHMSYNIREKGFFRHPIYGERVPYDLKRIKDVQIAICQGDSDMLATEANAKWLEEQFKENGNFRILGRYKALGHTGFLISHNSFEHYTDTLRFLLE